MPAPGSRLSPVAVATSCLLGTASGLRSQIGLAAVVVGLPQASLPSRLRHRAARPLSVIAAVGELVADKLPFTPSRTEPLGLSGRLALGALSSGVAASATGQGAGVPAAIGAGTAVGAAFAGKAARSALSRRLPAFVAAEIEDMVALGLAVVAVRVTRRSLPATDAGD